ncbi:MAG: hypothetical protein U1E22_06345, partial [Coriobacteriia bacterium]|nr:hypothetical protein [Coriobacteriia bacterium]
ITIAGSIVTSIDASLTPAGSISGHVAEAATSDPAVSVYVQVYSQDSDTGDWYRTGQKYTDNLGAYTVGSIPAGPAKVQFYDHLGRYAGQWFNEKPFLHRSDVTVVTAGATTVDVDASLGAAGTIRGRIYDRWTNDPAYGYVYLYDAMDGLGELHEVAWKDTPAGTYTFSGLPEWSDYVVGVDPPGPAGMRYYDDTDDAGWSTAFGVAAGEDIVGIDIPLDITPDTTAPGTHDDALALYYNSASIEVTASDDLSGVELIEYRLDSEATVTVAATSTVVATSSEAAHTLRYRAKDRAGNYSNLVVRDFDVVYDTAPPELSYAGWEAYQSVPYTTIEMMATDDVSGVLRLYWQVDGGETKTADADWFGEVIGGDGPHTLRFWAEDIAGNVSDDILLEFFLDQVKPTA